MKMIATLLIFLVISLNLVRVSGFTPVARRSVTDNTARFKVLGSKLFGPDEDVDDDIRRLQQNDQDASGMELAQDFYRELQERRRDTTIETPSGSRMDSSKMDVMNESFGKDFAAKSSMEPVINPSPLPKKKFTGNESSFYAPRPSSSSSTGQARTPREMMMEREYQLVGRAERGIVAQACVAVLALAFYIYIGLSGGIVSGSDIPSKDFGAYDEMPFEQLMPVQRDREVSVWL